MTRKVAVVAVLLLLSACSKAKSLKEVAESAASQATAVAEAAKSAAGEASETAKQAAAEAAENAKEAVAEAGEDAKDALAQASEEPQKIEVTEGRLKKYVAYQKKALSLFEAYVAELKKSAEKVDASKSVSDALAQAARLSKKNEALEADEQKAREEVGLSEDEVAAVRDVVNAVMTQRTIYEKSGGDAQLAELRKNIAKELEGLPAQSREAAKAQLEEVVKSFEDNKNAADARKQYGDEAVDLVLAHEDELGPLQEKMLKIGIGALQ